VEPTPDTSTVRVYASQEILSITLPGLAKLVLSPIIVYTADIQTVLGKDTMTAIDESEPFKVVIAGAGES
jgi:hypothetical protein